MTIPSLSSATLEQLSQGLAAGSFTSVELVKVYLARIEQVNPRLHAVTQINPDALAIAASLDHERAMGRVRGHLHGIPILVKNNIATADKTETTAGSTILLGAQVPHDAPIITHLHSSGAIILGKANLTEWANFRSNHVSNTGWSPHGGQTLAAYHINQSPGGSSGGSAVAADLGLAWAALGTETEGSILDPAWRSGIVGIKPTVGLTSRRLVVPISHRFDTVGPMARTVADAAALLGVIAGRDEGDEHTLEIPDRWRVEQLPPAGGALESRLSTCPASYAPPPLSLHGVRIGVPWNIINRALERDPDLHFQITAFRTALVDLTALGATIIPANFTADANTHTQITLLCQAVLRADFPTDLAAYLSQLVRNPLGLRSLSDVREHTRRDPREQCLPHRGTDIWDSILDNPSGSGSGSGSGSADPDPTAAYARLLQLAEGPGLPGALETHDLLAVAMPTSLAHLWAAVVGCPGITVPMGYYPATAPVRLKQPPAVGLDMVDTAPGVPMGLCFLGRKWSENDLIRLAYAFEQRTAWRAKGERVIVPQAELSLVALAPKL